MDKSKRGKNKTAADISKPFWFCKQWQTGAIREKKLDKNRNLHIREENNNTRQ